MKIGMILAKIKDIFNIEIPKTSYGLYKLGQLK